MPLNGIGLGYRREFNKEFWQLKPTLDFVEIAPENWLGLGGQRLIEFERLNANYRVICHGLSLSLGSVAPLNWDFLRELKTFLRRYNIKTYSEHLSYCTDPEGGYLYELLPLPFTHEAVQHISNRIKQVQDFLECTLALENITYYSKLPGELTEVEFINAIAAESNCDLLLDVNNIYVNSCNHHYNAKDFIQQLKANVAYLHLAGHEKISDQQWLDTHGRAVAEPVWQLLKHVFQQLGNVPTLLERDNNLPALSDLTLELDRIRHARSGQEAA